MSICLFSITAPPQMTEIYGENDREKNPPSSLMIQGLDCLTNEAL